MIYTVAILGAVAGFLWGSFTNSVRVKLTVGAICILFAAVSQSMIGAAS